MSAGQRFEWWTAFCVADSILRQLDGAYERCAIAGSLRRGKADVGDIEIVVIPNANFENRMARLVMAGILTKPLYPTGANRKMAPRWGEKTKFAQHAASGINVQVFSATAENWGYQYWLRTGPGDANDVMVTAKGVRNRFGRMGVLAHDLRFLEGNLWRMPEPTLARGSTLPPGSVIIPTPEESDVFRAVGIGYVLPPDRMPESYQDGGGGYDGDVTRFMADGVFSPSRRWWGFVPDSARHTVIESRAITKERAMPPELETA